MPKKIKREPVVMGLLHFMSESKPDISYFGVLTLMWCGFGDVRRLCAALGIELKEGSK